MVSPPWLLRIGAAVDISQWRIISDILLFLLDHEWLHKSICCRLLKDSNFRGKGGSKLTHRVSNPVSATEALNQTAANGTIFIGSDQIDSDQNASLILPLSIRSVAPDIFFSLQATFDRGARSKAASELKKTRKLLLFTQSGILAAGELRRMRPSAAATAVATGSIGRGAGREPNAPTSASAGG
eukprot:g78431.t1